MFNSNYNQILVNGKTHNIIRGDEDQGKNPVTIYIDEEENQGVACLRLSSIPSRTAANGRSFKTLGGTFKYL